MKTSELRFSNPEASPQEVRMTVNVEAIPMIVRWYAPYRNGDAYAVFVDGRKMALDLNGEIV